MSVLIDLFFTDMDGDRSRLGSFKCFRRQTPLLSSTLKHTYIRERTPSCIGIVSIWDYAYYYVFIHRNIIIITVESDRIQTDSAI